MIDLAFYLREKDCDRILRVSSIQLGQKSDLLIFIILINLRMDYA